MQPDDVRSRALDGRLDRIERAQVYTLAACQALQQQANDARTVSEPTRAQQLAEELEEEPRSPDNERALLASQEIFENALSKGRWIDEDKRRLQEVIGKLNSDEQFALLLTFSKHVNEDRIRLETAGSPL